MSDLSIENLTARDASNHLDQWLCSALENNVKLGDVEQLSEHFALMLSNELVGKNERLRYVNVILTHQIINYDVLQF